MCVRVSRGWYRGVGVLRLQRNEQCRYRGGTGGYVLYSQVATGLVVKHKAGIVSGRGVVKSAAEQWGVVESEW